MSIKQIKGKYLIQADRLMLTIVNTDDTQFRIILTRRLTKMITDTFNAYISKHSKKDSLNLVSEEMQRFNKAYALQGVTFGEKKATKTKEETNNPPEFINDVKFKKPQKNSKCLVQLSLSTHTQRKINISCNIKLMNVFLELMNKLESKTEWQVIKREVESHIKTKKRVLH